jgi:predicted O-methyltransferase YrrM
VLRPLLDGRPYLPWTEGAIRPAALVAVLNEITFAERREIVELGSGISSIVVGRLLAERGGKLTAVEHDPEWAQIVRSQIVRERLGDVIEVIVAPLEPHAASWSGAPWYSSEAVALLPDSISLLMVDGPPGYGEGMSHSRYPAMPALADRIPVGGMVFLDDAGREPEREIVARWSEEFTDWSFGIDVARGIALGTRSV